MICKDDEVKGTKMPYDILAFNFNTLMNDYVKLKEELNQETVTRLKLQHKLNLITAFTNDYYDGNHNPLSTVTRLREIIES